MKVAIVGGGFTGLTAAYDLAKSGHTVTVFERDDHLGGLAWGFREKNWNWHLEGAYHHLFTNDRAIINLVKEIGIGDSLLIKRPVTANLLPGIPEDTSSNIVQLDSPMHLLRFPRLSLTDKLRTGALAAFCKLYPFWQTLEGVTAKDFFMTWGGARAWEIIWEPLMTGKFGHFDHTIAASWLWARIKKRTPNLCYFEGGFQTVIETLARKIKEKKGSVLTNAAIQEISKLPDGTFALSWGGKKGQFDRILLTVPTPVAAKIIPFPAEYTKPLLSIPHLHAQVLILETDVPLLDEVYWLSITDRSYPFLAVVAHTNFMDKKHYGGHHLTYIGNYLPPDHPYLSLTKEQLLTKFMPYIRRLCPSVNNKHILNSFLFTGLYAQPVHQVHYSRRAPNLVTPVHHVYLANMDSVYPWDRGTNYAVELGQKAAVAITNGA